MGKNIVYYADEQENVVFKSSHNEEYFFFFFLDLTPVQHLDTLLILIISPWV